MTEAYGIGCERVSNSKEGKCEIMDKKEIEFEFERATKNTYRFQITEESEGYGGVGINDSCGDMSGH